MRFDIITMTLMATFLGRYVFGQDNEDSEYVTPNFEGKPVLHESARDRVTRLREHIKTNVTNATETKENIFQVLSVSTKATDCHSRQTPRSSKSTYVRHPKRSRDSGHSVNDSRRAEDRLQRLVLTLRSFVDGAQFHGENFGFLEKSLALQITETDARVRTLYFKNKQLTARTAFVKAMFVEMQEALSLIVFLSMGGTEARLLRSLVCLNAALLNLYDDYGSPDPLIPGYGISLKGFRQILVSWNNNFSFFPETPYGFQFLFFSPRQ